MRWAGRWTGTGWQMPWRAAHRWQAVVARTGLCASAAPKAGSARARLAGVVPVFLALLIGGFLGVLAGYTGGLVNSIVMRLTDVLYAFVHESGYLGQLTAADTPEAEEQVRNLAKLFSITQRTHGRGIK